MPIRTLSLIAGLCTAPLAGAAQTDLPDEWATRAVVEAYYAAIDAGEYDTAYAAWGDDGKASGQSPGEFAAGFAGTESAEVFTAPVTDLEGAAGSVYATVPVRIESRLADSAVQHFAGSYVLSRVNDVPGATEAQLAWHIRSADIRQTD